MCQLIKFANKTSLSTLLLTALCCLCSLPLHAQDYTLQGVVSDEYGPLPGVSIRIAHTKKGTTTDADGMYMFVFSEKKKTKLIFSFVGKQTKTIVWNGEKVINVKLKDEVSLMDEVVVTAKPNINEVESRTRTGSVLQADVQMLKNKPSPTLGLALQGNVQGLQVINTGELGSKPQIRIRGVSSLRQGDIPNEPLYVLDGQVISPETFFSLNPEDIKDIKLLKDAVATALYGTKAANGVLEMTSKRGVKGERSISYNMKMGITFRGQRTARMMDSKEKLELERLLENPVAPGFLYSEKYIRNTHPMDDNVDALVAAGARVLDSLSGIHTDWYRRLIRPNIYQSHTISVRGGGDKSSYYTSIGFTHNGGQVKGNDYKRFSGRLSLDEQLTPDAIAGISVNGALAQSNTPNGSEFSVYDLVYRLNPYETEDSKTLYSFPRRGYGDLFNQFSSHTSDKSLGLSGYLNWKILSGLELSAVAGLDYLLSENISIVPPTAFSELQSIAINERGKLSQYKNTSTNVTTNIRLTYQKTLGKHDFVVGANTDFYSTHYDDINLSGRGVSGKAWSAAAIDNSIDGHNRAVVGGRNETIRTFGVGVLAGYTYDKKYDIFATYKLDASSLLPKEKRNNTAWGVGGGIDLKQLPFLCDWQWLRTLKLRASYGYTANLQGVSYENTIATFVTADRGYDYIRGLQLLALPNKELEAEQNLILDYGFHLAIGDYTDIDVSLYRRITSNALLQIPIAASNGFIMQWKNIGVMENKGIDASLSQLIFKYREASARLRFNISYNKNKVVSLYDRDRLYSNPNSIIPDYEVGQPVDMIFGLHSLGINPITGEPTYLLHNGEQADVYYNFQREDFIPLGHSTPPITGGLTLNFAYSNWEMDVNFYYTIGGKRQYQYRYVRQFSDANQNAVKGQVGDMWFHSGDDGKRYPSPFIISAASLNLSYPTNRTVASTDMIRLNSLSLRYRLPKWMLQKMGNIASFATLGIDASNLFTLTRFSGSDPESGSIVAPLQPVLTGSIKVTF